MGYYQNIHQKIERQINYSKGRMRREFAEDSFLVFPSFGKFKNKQKLKIEGHIMREH
jgi:hypothetical protein